MNDQWDKVVDGCGGFDDGYDFSDLVRLSFPWDSECPVSGVVLCEPNSTAAFGVLFAVMHTGSVGVYCYRTVTEGGCKCVVPLGWYVGNVLWFCEDMEALC